MHAFQHCRRSRRKYVYGDNIFLGKIESRNVVVALLQGFLDVGRVYIDRKEITKRHASPLYVSASPKSISNQS